MCCLYDTNQNTKVAGLFFLCQYFVLRLAVIKEEKDAMSKALARLQRSDHCSAPGREDWRMNDVVRALEEQLIKERAKSQRSTSKRCQEQQLLVEQVKSLLWLVCCFLYSTSG